VGAEGLDGAGGVVAAAVELAVDRRLDPAAGRPEPGGHGQGGPGHHPARRVAGHPAGQLPEDQDQAGVDPGQQHGDQPVDHGAVDQPVDLVEAVAQDRHPGRDWQERHHHGEQQVGERVREPVAEHEQGQQSAGVGEPFELEALVASRAAEPDHQRHHRGHGQHPDQVEQDETGNVVLGVADRGHPNRVGHPAGA
jgi:hypothetical protein